MFKENFGKRQKVLSSMLEQKLNFFSNHTPHFLKLVNAPLPSPADPQSIQGYMIPEKNLASKDMFHLILFMIAILTLFLIICLGYCLYRAQKRQKDQIAKLKDEGKEVIK